MSNSKRFRVCNSTDDNEIFGMTGGGGGWLRGGGRPHEGTASPRRLVLLVGCTKPFHSFQDKGVPSSNHDACRKKFFWLATKIICGCGQNGV